MPKISSKHALTRQELIFCKIYVAFGFTNHSDAYRRAFMERRADGQYVAPPRTGMTADQLDAIEPITTKEINRRGKHLLSQDHIKAYIEEIGKPAGDHARGVLAEQAMFGAKAEALRAADKILEQEDKLGFRDAVTRFWEISCEIGAEVEVPLPHDVTGKVTCPHCAEGHEVTLPLRVLVPVEEMFPQFKKDE
jgi:hypothetical protein